MSIDSLSISQFASNAATGTEISAGDTAWVLASAALVMMMTPALAFFYGGMVRQKNVLATIMQSFVIIAVISVQWILWGYSLAFGPDIRGLIGSLDWVGLNGVGLGPNPDYAPTIPHQAFMIYQGMFAVITPALITGAFAERMKFRSFLLFVLLWFGWFGFNAGSALSSGALATSAFVATNTAGAMAALAWMTMSWWMNGRPSVIGTSCGAIAGLAAVTPAAGFITPMAAVIIGLGAGGLCYLACHIKARSNFVDDSLDVMGVHGVGGIWGVLSAGLFATVAVNAAGPNGLFYGNADQLVAQLVAVVATAVYSFVLTVVILKVIDFIFGLRVAPSEELHGLDITQHGEAAYSG